jgi:hypothetical protein
VQQLESKPRDLQGEQQRESGHAKEPTPLCERWQTTAHTEVHERPERKERQAATKRYPALNWRGCRPDLQELETLWRHAV